MKTSIQWTTSQTTTPAGLNAFNGSAINPSHRNNTSTI